MAGRLALVAMAALLAGCGSSGSASRSPSPGSTPSAAMRLAVARDAMPVGEVGIVYPRIPMSATGGYIPYAWSVGSGSLPTGLTMTPAGVITGLPAAAGEFTFDAVVSDSRGGKATDWCTIRIVPALIAQPLRSGSVIVEHGTSGGPFAQLAGGLGPYVYKVTSGAVPSGTTLQDLALTGTFNASGVYTFRVGITDSLGATASVSSTYIVFAPLTFARPSPGSSFNASCTGTVSTGCTASVTFSGGYPGATALMTWYAADLAGNRIDPNVIVNHDLVAPVISGRTVTVTFNSDRIGTGGGIGWNGQVVITLTDPVTSESTTAHVRVQVTFTP